MTQTRLLRFGTLIWLLAAHHAADSAEMAQLIFWSDRDRAGTQGDVFSVNVDGSGLRNLTAGILPDGGWGPALSPDGTTVAIGAEWFAGRSIYLLDLVTGAARSALAEDRFSSRFSWAPDGEHLAFSGWSDVSSEECESSPGSYYNGCFDVWVLNVETGEITKMTAITEVPTSGW